MIDSINSVAAAIHSALITDLLPIEYPYYSPGKKDQAKKRSRRPTRWDINNVLLFQQTWGSTALGFGGMGGAAMTTADTVIVFGHYREACVYFGDRFAYMVRTPNEKFYEDIKNQYMTDVQGAKSYERTV